MQARIPPQLVSRIRPITVAEYHRMIEVGALHEGERIELIEGAIIEMAAHGVPHALAVQRLQRRLERASGDAWVVRTQLPIIIGDRNEPEPDLALVATADAEGPEHPRHAALVIEVADTSLQDDRDVKAALYARGAIPEYWIVDIRGAAILVHRDPSPNEGRYTTVTSVSRDASVSPLALPTLVVRFADLVR